MSFPRSCDEARSRAELAAALSDFEVGVLEVATAPTYVRGQLESRIIERLGCSTSAYFQTLNRLIDDERAIARYPVLTARLRRQRDHAETRRGR